MVETFAFGGAEGGAVICAAKGSIAAAPFVGEDHWLCAGIKTVLFSQPTLQMFMFDLCQCSYFIIILKYHPTARSVAGRGLSPH